MPRSLRRLATVVVSPLAILSSAALLAGCGSSSSKPTAMVTMGVILDLTSQTGGLIAIPDVVQFAIDDMNAGISKAGGFNGLGFTHSDGDSSGSGTATISGSLATMLVQQGAKMIITDNSNNTVAVIKDDYDADTTNDLNSPILCVLCGSSLINNPAAVNADAVTQAALRNDKGWNFRVIQDSKYFAPIAVARALAMASTDGSGDGNGDGLVKASLYGSNEPQGLASVNSFAAALLAAKPAASIEKIFHDPAADPNGTLWATDSGRLTDNRNETTNTVDGLPDIVYESSLPGTAIAFTKSYVQGNYGIPLLHGAPFGNETATLTLGDLANGQEGVGYATYYPGASANFFIQSYLKHFGKMPESHERDGGTTYDAIMLGALATMVAAKDLDDPSQVTGDEIRAAMWKLNDPAGTEILAGPDGIAQAIPLIKAGMPINYRGISGPLDFDAHAFVLGAMVHWTIANGHFVDQQIYDCTQGAPCTIIPQTTP
jgi:hypothetical protein